MTIVVHHGAQGWTAPRRFHAIVDGLDDIPELRRFVPDFELRVDDLVTADDAQLRGRPLEAFPKIALWLLRDGRSIELFLEHLVAWADELERLTIEDPARDDYWTVLRYIWRVVGNVPYEVVRQRLIEVAPTFGEAMPSVEEQLIEKGRREGLEKGREEGREAFARDMLGVILRARFGVVDERAKQRIDQAAIAELQRWMERAAVAARIEDVFDA